jgi:hypothetical protein
VEEAGVGRRSVGRAPRLLIRLKGKRMGACFITAVQGQPFACVVGLEGVLAVKEG